MLRPDFGEVVMPLDRVSEQRFGVPVGQRDEVLAERPAKRSPKARVAKEAS